jgi:hypothetical protein
MDHLYRFRVTVRSYSIGFKKLTEVVAKNNKKVAIFDRQSIGCRSARIFAGLNNASQ